ncbi:hypothetical protein OUZ56_012127 [Daphnia magna]|uniref:Uncharacterized protein n=1 Tax=Daphnia magna TaxID=35525 RepID=A0ABQ9Z250_9CRUS|nr:hypothetical protein OUZ56_012127 [Daphnia magna]
MEATEKRRFKDSLSDSNGIYKKIKAIQFQNLTTGFKRFRGRKPRRRSGCMGKFNVSGIGLEGNEIVGELIIKFGVGGIVSCLIKF